MMILLVILVLGGYALYTMTPDERTRLRERLVATAHRAKDEAARRQAEPEPFRDALRQRTPWPIVMPAFVALNVIVFLMMGGGGSPRETGRVGRQLRTAHDQWRVVAAGRIDVRAHGLSAAPRQLRRPRAAGADPRAPRRTHHVRRGVPRRRRSCESRHAVGLSDGHYCRRLRRHLRSVRAPRGLVRVDGHPARSSPGSRAATGHHRHLRVQSTGN